MVVDEVVEIVEVVEADVPFVILKRDDIVSFVMFEKIVVVEIVEGIEEVDVSLVMFWRTVVDERF